MYLRKQGRVTARVVSSQDTLAYAKVLAKKYKSENSQRSRWKALQAWFSWMIAEKGVPTVGTIFPRGTGPKVTPRVRKDKDTFPVLRDVAATLDALTYRAQRDRPVSFLANGGPGASEGAIGDAIRKSLDEEVPKLGKGFAVKPQGQTKLIRETGISFVFGLL